MGHTSWALSLAGSAMNMGTFWETRNCFAFCLATYTSPAIGCNDHISPPWPASWT